jgi:nitrogen fixation protein FixH
MSARGTLKGGHVLAYLLGAFAVVLAVNIGFIVIAIKSFPGEEEEKSYAQGLAFNATLQDRQAQSALGWRAIAALEQTAQRGGAVLITLTDGEGRPLSGARIEGALRRPTDAELDFPLAFAEVSAGIYTAKTHGLHEGQWELAVRATRGTHHFDITKRLLWPRSTPS